MTFTEQHHAPFSLRQGAVEGSQLPPVQSTQCPPRESRRTVPLPVGLEIKDGQAFTDALEGPAVTAQGGAVTITLPARSAAVYLPK